jgi:hypothetical protein
VASGITLVWVVESVHITPEPADEERRAIVAALAAEAAERASSPWADVLLPNREGEDDSAYPE